MRRFIKLILFFFVFYPLSDLYGIRQDISARIQVRISVQDTLAENQVLYNGKIWRNIYFMVQEDQFLFTKEFLKGEVTISGKTFNDIYLKYDIYKDELLTPVNPGGILQLNKELVDSFSIYFQNKKYRFFKLQDDSLKGPKKYFNVLYKGKTSLYLQYSKKIEKLAVEGKYDKFYQLSRIYFVKGNIFYPVAGKSDLMKILPEEKALIKNYIKKNKLDVSEKEPESFVPVVRYYDNIRQ